MKFHHLLLLLALALSLSACFDNDHPPQGAGGLTSEVKAPMDKAQGVNQMVEDQDAAQRKAMDEQGK